MNENKVEDNNIKKINNFNDNSNNDENKQFLPNEDNYLKKDYFNDFYFNNTIMRNPKDLIPKLDLSRYKTKKLFRITFYKIGNIYVFGFINNSSDPLFCIDKMWYLHLLIFLIEIILVYVGNHYLFNKLEHWKQMIFNILSISFFFIYSALILINPGIVITSQKGYTHTGYCKRCNIYFLPENNVYHCFDCDICVKKIDHHCSFLRKCITKKNYVIFVLMLVFFVLIYIHLLINTVLFCIDFYKKKKKKL